MASEEREQQKDKAEKSLRKPDMRLVEIDNPGELAFWMKWFAASENELHEAVRAVGNTAQDIALYLEEQRRSR